MGDFDERNPECKICDLCPGGERGIAKTCCVWGTGNPNAKIMLVGLGPGAREDKEGKPFVGAAGGKLNQMLKVCKIRREDIYITNAVKCRPPDNKPKSKEIRLCYQYLANEIEQVNPKLVVAMGHVAYQSLQGRKASESMEKLIGKVYHLRKFPKTKLMVAVHPAATLRSSHNEKRFATSWVSIKKYLDGALLNSEDLGDYKILTNPREIFRVIQQCRQAGLCMFAFDCETGFDFTTIDTDWTKALNDKVLEKMALKWEFPGFFIKSLSISPSPRISYCIPFNYPVGADFSRWYWKPEIQGMIINELKKLFEDPNVAKIAHHINFDRHAVERKFGCVIRGLLHDTVLQHFLLVDYKPHTLEEIAWEETQIGDYTRECDDLGGVEKANGIPLFRKNMADSDITMRLFHKFPARLIADHTDQVYLNLQMPSLNSLYRIEERGFPVDLERWEEVRKRSDVLYKEYYDKVVNHKLMKQAAKAMKVDVNPNADAQLRHVFYDILKYEPLKKTDAAQLPSVDSESLDYLLAKHKAPLATEILKYKKIAKLKSTYIDGMRPVVAPDGRIHARYNLHIARTGRTSSDNPNLQNIPKGWDERPWIKELLDQLDVREVFIAEPGYILAEYDFNQHELRVTAMASHDPILTDAYRTIPNKDIHSVTASGICQAQNLLRGDTYEKFLRWKASKSDDASRIRRDAKIINFGLIYGKWINTLAKELKVDWDMAEAYYNAFWKQYKGIGVWKEKTELFLEANKFTIALTGRKRRFPFVDWKARKEGVNHIIQATASDLMLMAINTLHAIFDKYGFKTYICAEVHDSILFQIHESELEQMKQIIPYYMENPRVNFLWVPLKVDCKVGMRWSNLKEV